MTLLQEQATADIEKSKGGTLLKMMERGFGTVPMPLQLFSRSSGLLEVQAEMINYYANHARFSSELMAFIRYTTAHQLGFRPCFEFNQKMLAGMGVTEQELDVVLENPESAPLEENEVALLAFICRSVKDQSGASQQNIDDLKRLGWRESDILDGVTHGFNMVGPALMLQLFKMV